MPFLDSLDIANRALQHCGQPQIAATDEDSKNNLEATFAYDKVRRAELRRNFWRFAIRTTALRPISATTLLVNAPLYDSAATYLLGAVVRDANRQYWISLEAENVNNTPGGNNEAWDSYFGPLTVSLWDSAASYYAGELVYMAGAAAGSYQVYMSLSNANGDAPNVADQWDVATTYYQDQVVSYSGSQWRSLLPFNVGITPADGPLPFDATATYSAAQTVTASDEFIYSSVGNGNIGHDPTTDAGVHWTNTGVANGWSRSPTLVVSAKSWLPIGPVALKSLSMLYPVGSGATNDPTTKNIYRLPAGFLREAPQDPKAGATSYLGAPGGRLYSDWAYQGEYLITQDNGVIIYRFVADMTKVSAMDDMFCEGLALTIALAACPSLTQSEAKMATIASEYKLRMSEARTVNAIEVGSFEAPMDDYIACRA